MLLWGQDHRSPNINEATPRRQLLRVQAGYTREVARILKLWFSAAGKSYNENKMADCYMSLEQVLKNTGNKKSFSQG